MTDFPTEPGAEGLPQLVIPGTERASDRELLLRRSADPRGPKVAQTLTMPEAGLWGDHGQMSLF